MNNPKSISTGVGVAGILLSVLFVGLGLYYGNSGMVLFGLLVGGGGIGASALINKYS